MIIAKGGAHSLFILSKGQTFRRYSGSPLEARFTLKVSVHNGRLRRPGVPVFTGGNAAVWRRRQKGARAPNGSLAPSCLPQTLLCAATPFGCAAKRGLRELGSVRFSDYMWL